TSMRCVGACRGSALYAGIVGLRPPRQSMLLVVVALRENLQVLVSIVALVPVDVMHVLASFERAPQQALRDHAMFEPPAVGAGTRGDFHPEIARRNAVGFVRAMPSERLDALRPRSQGSSTAVLTQTRKPIGAARCLGFDGRHWTTTATAWTSRTGSSGHEHTLSQQGVRTWRV